MDMAEVLSVVRRVDGVDPLCTDREVLTGALSDVRRLISWAEAQQARVAAQLAHVSGFVERDIADAGRCGLRDANRVVERTEVLDVMPVFGDALRGGEVTGRHVDIVGGAWRSLEPELRPQLVDAGERLAVIARNTDTDEFARLMRGEVRRIEADDGMARLERQRRATRLRTWIDGASGMYKVVGEFDPVSGATLAGRLSAMVGTLFADTVPDTCPTDPGAKQDHLRALALLALTDGRGPRAGRAEVVVVVDTTKPDAQGRPDVDWGIPVEVPMRVLAELIDTADVHTVAVRNGVVLHAPGHLQLGRTTRVANRAQRRALRAFHASCAVPGCTVRYAHCKVHHVVWWRHGGLTDLDNLLPVCERHHHQIHADGWSITVLADRSIVVELPDGSMLADAPPGRSAA